MSGQEEILTPAQSLGGLLETAELFGEEDFLLLKPEQKRFGTQASRSSQRAPSKREKLDALYEKYENCQNCPLALSRNKIVFGMGSFDPKVLFIGEGPGYEEDRLGLPFVGKAGELLDKILLAIGLDRSSIYIANIVKCHPMKNPNEPQSRGNDRAPDPREIEACKPILDQQIEILQPPILCALGSTAAKALLESNEGITRLRGKVYDFTYPISKRVVPIIPTYHPAALLRNPELKRDAWNDMKLLREVLKRTESDKQGKAVSEREP